MTAPLTPKIVHILGAVNDREPCPYWMVLRYHAWVRSRKRVNRGAIVCRYCGAPRIFHGEVEGASDDRT